MSAQGGFDGEVVLDDNSGTVSPIAAAQFRCLSFRWLTDLPRAMLGA